MSDLKVTARVQMTIEIELTQPWSPAETTEAVFRQAEAQAMAHARKLTVAGSGCGVFVRIVGEPDVTAVMAALRER